MNKKDFDYACERYIHACLVKLQMPFDYTFETRRIEAHFDIAEYLEIESQDKKLLSILHYMDEQIGFPIEFCFDGNDDDKTVKKFTKKLSEKLLEMFGRD